ncbi:MAG: class I SAM-dependent methyltransferase [Planctomycetales bacterium]
MVDRPIDEAFRRFAEDVRRTGLDALLSFQERLRCYAGLPGIASESDRTAIREDAIILAVSDLLSTHPRPQLRVLDACCGHGGLAAHLANNLSAGASRVAYLGIDQSSKHIARARRLPLVPEKLHSLEFRLGEVWHLPQEWHATVDLVVLSNTLHELPSHRFPELFAAFNGVIVPNEGRVCVIDMEELPVGEPEAIAINWKLEEVEAILSAGGFKVTPSNHPKSVAVFRIVVQHAEKIDSLGMLNEIRSRLRKKLAIHAQERAEAVEEAYVDDDSLLNWIVLTGSVARCAEELLLVEQRIDELSGTVPNSRSES